MYLSECINSILRQSYSFLQVVCVDDGSSDHSSEIIESFKVQDARVEVITTSNKGVSVARNKGLEISRGEYVCFVDSDDWLDEKIIEIEIIHAIESNLDLVIAGNTNVYSKKQIVNKPFDGHRNFNESNINQLRQRFVGLNDNELKRPESIDWLSCLHGKLYKREIVEKQNIKFDENLVIGEDTLFNIQYAMYINKACFLPSPLYYYRKSNPLSITKQYKPYLLEMWKIVHNRIKETINNDEGYKTPFQNRVALSIIGLCVNETRMRASFVGKSRRLSEVLQSDLYINAFNNLTLSPMPLRWKIFFFSIKHHYTYLFGVMAILLKKIIDRKL